MTVIATTLTDLLPADPDPDALYDAFVGWADGQGLTLYPAQADALIEMVSGEPGQGRSSVGSRE